MASAMAKVPGARLAPFHRHACRSGRLPAQADRSKLGAQAAAKRNEIMISTIAGALSSDQAKDVLQVAYRRLKEANL